jgi:hypothetical protein
LSPEHLEPLTLRLDHLGALINEDGAVRPAREEEELVRCGSEGAHSPRVRTDRLATWAELVCDRPVFTP